MRFFNTKRVCSRLCHCFKPELFFVCIFFVRPFIQIKYSVSSLFYFRFNSRFVCRKPSILFRNKSCRLNRRINNIRQKFIQIKAHRHFRNITIVKPVSSNPVLPPPLSKLLILLPNSVPKNLRLVFNLIIHVINNTSFFNKKIVRS